jgi:purine-nucleoside phosphorylase
MPDATNIERNVDEAVAFIREHAPHDPEIALVLGSGLGGFTDALQRDAVIPVENVPHYPRSTVPGHKGEIVFARLGSIRIMAFRGRVHFYESGSLDVVLFPIRVAAALGARTLIATNAAGGINRTFVPGDLMLITDQINFTGEALRWAVPPRQASSGHYDSQYLALAAKAAASQGIPVVRGVYAGVKGPSYETAAEIEMLYRLGGDAVGMSTVMETALAAQLGMKVLGISCITNKATGTSPAKLNHAEVTLVADQVREHFTRLLKHIILAHVPGWVAPDGMPAPAGSGH